MKKDNNNRSFLNGKAKEIKHARAVAPTKENMAKNIARVIENRDRTDGEFQAFIEANNVSTTDTRGVDRIPVTRDVINELRTDAASMTVGSGGTELENTVLGSFGASWKVNGKNQAGVYANYAQLRPVSGQPVVNQVSVIAIDSDISEIQDGDLNNPTITSEDVDLQRSFIGSSYSSVRGKLHGSELTANVIESLKVGLDGELDKMAFAGAYGAIAPVSIGATASNWKEAFFSAIYGAGFVSPRIIMPYASAAAFMSAQDNGDVFGEIAGIPVFGTQAYAADADRAIVVDGASSVMIAEYDMTLMVDKFTGAQMGVTKHMIQAMHGVSVLDDSAVLSFDLA